MILAFYQKKPVVVEAQKLSPENADKLAEWCGGLKVEELDAVDSSKTYVGINIPTLEGNMRASEGDYIVKGTRGEFYPVKEGPFADTFDKVEI